MISPPGATTPRLTALVTCRNAAATLNRLLEHLDWHGAETIVIDNGSTDGTADIARSHVGKSVSEVISDPFQGYFDLTHQLTLKCDLMRSMDEGWILHADADEFVDSPIGSPLTDYLGYWDDAGIDAFDCDEYMFLPLSEDDRHTPESFLETMQAYVPFSERDPKQRLFRANAPLKRWLQTGGHTIAGPDDVVAPVRLPLRHYFGLSLDQIRAEYLPRVFAQGDLGKLWHGNRTGTALTVVTPDPDRFFRATDGWICEPSESRVPVFRTKRNRQENNPLAGDADLHIVALSKATRESAADKVTAAIPGLRVSQSAKSPADYCSVLNVLEHPVRAGSDTLANAENWLRHVAAIRQYGLSGAGPYAEVRIEDVEQSPQPMIETVRHMILGHSGQPGLTLRPSKHAADGYEGRFRDITLPAARDLGYH